MNTNPQRVDVARLSALIATYWDLGYAEGREGRTHDTCHADAAACWSEIDAILQQLAERERDVAFYRTAAGESLRIAGEFERRAEAAERGETITQLRAKLAERDAEIARLNRLADAISRDCNDCANQRNEAMAKAVAAERAREEATSLLYEADAYLCTARIAAETRDRIAAFLAANGGACED